MPGVLLSFVNADSRGLSARSRRHGDCSCVTPSRPCIVRTSYEDADLRDTIAVRPPFRNPPVVAYATESSFQRSNKENLRNDRLSRSAVFQFIGGPVDDGQPIRFRHSGRQYEVERRTGDVRTVIRPGGDVSRPAMAVLLVCIRYSQN